MKSVVDVSSIVLKVSETCHKLVSAMADFRIKKQDLAGGMGEEVDKTDVTWKTSYIYGEGLARLSWWHLVD